MLHCFPDEEVVCYDCASVLAYDSDIKLTFSPAMTEGKEEAEETRLRSVCGQHPFQKAVSCENIVLTKHNIGSCCLSFSRSCRRGPKYLSSKKSQSSIFFQTKTLLAV